jgi:hypothetical protein
VRKKHAVAGKKSRRDRGLTNWGRFLPQENIVCWGSSSSRQPLKAERIGNHLRTEALFWSAQRCWRKRGSPEGLWSLRSLDPRRDDTTSLFPPGNGELGIR